MYHNKINVYMYIMYMCVQVYLYMCVYIHVNETMMADCANKDSTYV